MVSSPLRILVTGACGSVGSALTRRLVEQGHVVCVFDQSEDGLFCLDQELRVKAEGRLRTFLGNVRDLERLKVAMERVDIVYHCAALKHVGLSEYNPFEAMQTNIIGTHNVIQAAIFNSVSRVILTSSDKAVNPTSTMGATKLLGERLFIGANNHAGKHKTRFSCVRFGNVLNSNGSVLQIFRRQLDRNEALTITSTDMTRFFLTMQQAVDLCLEAADRMVGGEIFVKSMGYCSILSLARALCADKPLQYVEIGPKPGEKLYEELVTEGEASRTACDGNTYIVLPETQNVVLEDILEAYEKYRGLPRLASPLRSDDGDFLPDNKVVEMLESALQGSL